MKREIVKNIIIVTTSIIVVLCGLYVYRYWGDAESGNIKLEVTNVYTNEVGENSNGIKSEVVNDTQNRIGDSWVKGNYRYTVEKRSGPFYFVSATNNTSECLNAKAADDLVPCTGGGYYGKDGESWGQPLSEALDCNKIVSLGFPKDFDGNISSCYNN